MTKFKKIWRLPMDLTKDRGGHVRNLVPVEVLERLDRIEWDKSSWVGGYVRDGQ